MSGSNTHTEAEALERLCQETLGPVLVGSLVVQQFPHNCYASACMAWLWSPTPDNVPRGYCGLLHRG